MRARKSACVIACVAAGKAEQRQGQGERGKEDGKTGKGERGEGANKYAKTDRSQNGSPPPPPAAVPAAAAPLALSKLAAAAAARSLPPQPPHSSRELWGPDRSRPAPPAREWAAAVGPSGSGARADRPRRPESIRVNPRLSESVSRRLGSGLPLTSDELQRRGRSPRLFRATKGRRGKMARENGARPRLDGAVPAPASDGRVRLGQTRIDSDRLVPAPGRSAGRPHRARARHTGRTLRRTPAFAGLARIGLGQSSARPGPTRMDADSATALAGADEGRRRQADNTRTDSDRLGWMRKAAPAGG